MKRWIGVSFVLVLLLLVSCQGKDVSVENAPATILPKATVEVTATPVSSSPTLDALLAEMANKKATEEASGIVATEVPSAMELYGDYEFEWWNETVFYEVFVRSFADSDGDGIGDFKGLTAKLDYLNDGDPTTDDDLGITGIWLMPIMPSPSYHGYDVTNYQKINPEYGTMEDFETFLAEAHARGIRVIIDFVVNHTSDKHPYFTLSENPDSFYADWYRWEDEAPGELGPWGQKVWHQDGVNDKYYFGMFWSGMPDLNYETPAVTQMMYGHADYWLNGVGVDGLRIDAARYLIEDETSLENTDATHAWFQDFYQFYKAEKPEAMTVLEVWASRFESASYVKEDGSDLTFDFDQAEQVMQGVSSRKVNTIYAGLNGAVDYYPSYQYASFLTNHDMNRVMSEFMGDVQNAKVAATVLLTSPGVPFIYYGEEIGMEGMKPDEWIRTPMQWDASEGAGFTTGTPWELINDDKDEVNVAVQAADENSLLSLYRDLIHLRTEMPALSIGEMYTLDSGNRNIFGMLRVLDDEIVLVLFNLYDEDVTSYGFDLSGSSLTEGTYVAEWVYGDDMGDLSELQVNEAGGFVYQPSPSMLGNQISIYKFTPVGD
jgi:glycosidase